MTDNTIECFDSEYFFSLMTDPHRALEIINKSITKIDEEVNSCFTSLSKKSALNKSRLYTYAAECYSEIGEKRKSEEYYRKSKELIYEHSLDNMRKNHIFTLLTLAGLDINRNNQKLLIDLEGSEKTFLEQFRKDGVTKLPADNVTRSTLRIDDVDEESVARLNNYTFEHMVAFAKLLRLKSKRYRFEAKFEQSILYLERAVWVQKLLVKRAESDKKREIVERLRLAEDLIDLAVTLRQVGKAEKSLEKLEETQKIIRELLEEGDTKNREKANSLMADCLNNIGNTKRHLGRQAHLRAEHFIEALNILTKQFVTDRKLKKTDLFQEYLLFTDLFQENLLFEEENLHKIVEVALDEANRNPVQESLLLDKKKLKKIVEFALGETNRNPKMSRQVAHILSGLGFHYEAIGKRSRAERCYKASLAIKSKLFALGEVPAAVLARAYDDLGQIESNSGALYEIQDSIKHHFEAIVHYLTTFKKDGLITLRTIPDLLYPDAELDQCLKEVLEITKKAEKTSHDFATCLDNLGVAVIKLNANRFSYASGTIEYPDRDAVEQLHNKAIQLHEKALEIKESIFKEYLNHLRECLQI